MPGRQALQDIERDPVCGMTVDAETAQHSHRHDGEEFHFCSKHCHEKFAAQPDEFIESTDPVCGMSVSRKTADYTAAHDGQRFYF